MQIMGAKKIQDYLDKAFSLIQDDGTFAAKSHKKDALAYVSGAYQIIRDANGRFALDHLSREDYWAIPFDLYQIREKHMRLFDLALHADLDKLVALRAELKEMDVIKPAPKSDRVEKKHKEVAKTVHEMIEKRMAQYHEAIEIGRLFGGLPVSATPHLVTNEHGTTFTRCFYYLDGKMTPLAVIMAASDALAREKEGAI